MLVLTRRLNENLIIQDRGKIKITVLGVKGSQVKIGVEAPKDISIDREEIWMLKRKNHKHKE